MLFHKIEKLTHPLYKEVANWVIHVVENFFFTNHKNEEIIN